MAAVLASASAEEIPLVANALQALARASGTSEVLTLNITNLIILLIIKAIIIGFGIFAGQNNNNNQRSYDEATSVTTTDLNGGLCFMMYTSGATDKLNCIKRSACEDPKTAKDYLTGAKMWMKIHQLMDFVPFDANYYDIMTHVQEAAEHAAKGGDCQVYPW